MQLLKDLITACREKHGDVEITVLESSEEEDDDEAKARPQLL